MTDSLETKEPCSIYEEEITEGSSNQKLIYDKNRYEKLKQIDFTMSERFFKQPFREKFARPKSEILVISDREQAMDIRQTEGKTCIPLIDKRTILSEIGKIQNKEKRVTYQYVELTATEIIIKAAFTAGIDTPLELMMVDERIRYPPEKGIIAQLKGNLIYQKVKFIIKPDYSISITDDHIDKAYVLYYKLNGIKMPPGAKVMSIRCKNAYIISTKHNIRTKKKLDSVTIERPFSDILKNLDYKT